MLTKVGIPPKIIKTDKYIVDHHSGFVNNQLWQEIQDFQNYNIEEELGLFELHQMKTSQLSENLIGRLERKCVKMNNLIALNDYSPEMIIYLNGKLMTIIIGEKNIIVEYTSYIVYIIIPLLKIKCFWMNLWK